MVYLSFILVALALLIGFFILTSREMRRGERVFAPERDRLDKSVARIEFILEQVDLGAFLRNEIRRMAGRFGHMVAHLSLQAIRATERLLTRLVRHLRMRHEIDATPRESARPFVKTLSDFKSRLKATHPEIMDIR